MTIQFFILSLLVCLGATCTKNVLFLVADDMRSQLGAYKDGNGNGFPSSVSPTMVTPNIDELAAKSILFRNAYVQQALCSPSRTSVLTGRRPDATLTYDLDTYWREVSGNFTTLPQYFKDEGYLSIGMGKILHHGNASGGDYDQMSWSEPFWDGVANFENKFYSWRGIKAAKLATEPLIDEQVADRAIKVLQDNAQDARDGIQNIFLAVGFHKPHLPFVVPEEYLDYYPEADISLPDNDLAPANMPEIAWKKYGELRNYKDINATGEINTTLDDTTVKELRRAYYAAITWTDYQIGRVVNELKNQSLENDTVIVLWGDHGFQLGEHGGWCKQTNFELSTHAPLILHIPGVTDSGIETDELVEFVDIFPTVVEAAGLTQVSLCPVDSTNTVLCREGISLVPLITSPNVALKNASFSQSPRADSGTTIMGYSMRTDQYRYTEYPEFNYTTFTPDWTSLHGAELYDHDTDPDENFNQVFNSSYDTVIDDLSVALHHGWRYALQ